jgi:hypothetical protein
MEDNDYAAERNRDDEERASKAVQNLTKFVNNLSCPMKMFTKLMMQEHRTLQQSTMRLIIATIEEWSKQENYDLRNEQTIKICKKIMDAINDEKHLPFV